jgi:hypothetical protein
MAIPVRLFGPQLADLTAETVFTVPTGRKVLLESFTMQNTTAGAATTIRLTIGADAATTRIIEYSVPAGPVNVIIVYPRVVLNSAETVQLSSTVTDDVVVCTASGFEY